MAEDAERGGVAGGESFSVAVFPAMTAQVSGFYGLQPAVAVGEAAELSV